MKAVSDWKKGNGTQKGNSGGEKKKTGKSKRTQSLYKEKGRKREVA